MTTFALREPWRPSPGEESARAAAAPIRGQWRVDGQPRRPISVSRPCDWHCAEPIVTRDACSSFDGWRLHQWDVEIVSKGGVSAGSSWKHRGPYYSADTVSLTSLTANVSIEGQFDPKQSDNRADQWAFEPLVHYEERSVMQLAHCKRIISLF